MRDYSSESKTVPGIFTEAGHGLGPQRQRAIMRPRASFVCVNLLIQTQLFNIATSMHPCAPVVHDQLSASADLHTSAHGMFFL